MSTFLHRLRDRWIDGVLRHHRLILVSGALLTAASVYAASHLKIESDMRALLPDDHLVVENLRALEASFGVLGDVKVLVEGGSKAARNAYVEALVPVLQASPNLRDVDYRLRSDFFIDRALYYLSDEEFTELQEHVEAWQHYELCTATPDTCLEPPDPRAPARLRRLVDDHRARAVSRTGFEDYYEREGVEAQVLLAFPTRPSTDAAFATAVVKEVNEAARAQLERPGPWTGSGLKTSIIGRYVSQAEVSEAVNRDVVRSGAAGLLGVLVILFVLFRSLRAIFTLLLPLLCGVAWSMGLTQIILGHLNAITALITTVLVGIGIDAGIHFFARVRRELAEHPQDEAIRRAFRGLIAPLLIAAATTVSAFVVMASSGFPAFHEFGLIAAIGMVLCLIAMITVFPALLHLVGVKPPRRPPSDRPGLWARLLVRRPGLIFGAAALFTVLAFQGVRRVEFERNGRALLSDQARARTERENEVVQQIFGSQVVAAYLLVDDLPAAAALLATAGPRHAARKAAGDSLVSALVGPGALLPPPEIDQDARREAIAELAEALPERALARLEEPEAAAADDMMTARDARMLRRMLAARPFGVDDLPPQILSQIRGVDGRYAVLAYMDFDGADIIHGARFLEETSAYTGDRPGAAYVAETTAYVAIFELMQEEAPIVVGMALVLIIALVFWQLRSLAAALLTILPLALAFWWMSAAMGWLGVRYTLLNVPILPAILGLGVDNGVYLMDRLRRARTLGDIARSIRETGAAILAATATTMVGFAAFIVAESGGLRAIGELAVLGIVMAALAALTVLPAIAVIQAQPRLRRRRSKRRRDSRAPLQPPPA